MDNLTGLSKENKDFPFKETRDLRENKESKEAEIKRKILGMK